MKPLFERLLATLVLLITSPFIACMALIVFLEDRHFPFYRAPRVGHRGRPFIMWQLRSMIPNAAKTRVDSTADNDPRITRCGHLIRRFKLDEFTQFYNVVIGTMALVGPRPNVQREVDLYTKQEQQLLSVKPGITSIASLVFSDIGTILQSHTDPDLAYNQLIRPWKSRLDLFYIEHQSLSLDIKLLLLTALSLISRRYTLHLLTKLLKKLDADENLINTANRKMPLTPMPPPGASHIVTSRNPLAQHRASSSTKNPTEVL